MQAGKLFTAHLILENVASWRIHGEINKYMGWLPFEDKIAGKSEEIILKYNPKWTGCGDTVHPVWVPDEHWKMLMDNAPEQFNIKHYISIAVLERKHSEAL